MRQKFGQDNRSPCGHRELPHSGSSRESHNYPLVECDNHAPAPGYLACRCVIYKGARPLTWLDPTPDTLGQILCDRGTDHARSEIMLVCAGCVADRKLRARIAN